MAYIEIEKYHKTIKKRVILKNINLSVETGSVSGFTGANGSGKTMLFRAVCGLIRADSGTVKVGGKIIGRDISFPENLGVMIENAGLWPQYTGMENLRILSSFRKRIGEREIREAIARVGLDPDDKRVYKNIRWA